MQRLQNVHTEATNQTRPDPSAQLYPPKLAVSATTSKPSSSDISMSMPEETITTTINVYKVIEKANTSLDFQ